jgi:hypothetical protein
MRGLWRMCVHGLCVGRRAEARMSLLMAAAGPCVSRPYCQPAGQLTRRRGLWCGVRGGGKGCIRNTGTAGCPPQERPVEHDLCGGIGCTALLDPRHVSDVHRADDLSGDHRWPKMAGIQGVCYMRGLLFEPFDDRFYS